MGNKQIYILAIYQAQACIEIEEDQFSIIPVENQMNKRLSSTLGNVNLSDYWLAQGDEICARDFSYSCQYVGLLNDENGDENWLESMSGKYVCVQFLKVLVEEDQTHEIEPYIRGVKNLIMQIPEWDGRLFRTIDNADLVLIIWEENKENLLRKADCIEKWLKEKLFSFYSMTGSAKKDKGQLKVTWHQEDSDYLRKEGWCQKHKLYHGWCKNAISRLKKDLKTYEIEKNKKMSAYYRALIQFIGTLAQYEQRQIWKDLFFIFYPSISLFLEQLQLGKDKIEIAKRNIQTAKSEQERLEYTNERDDRIEKVECAIQQFIDSIEVLLYHMGHSCSDIIGKNGRGGMPFDIPIRLCLMYISFMHLLSRILDDKGYKYQYCLDPLIYSRPITNCIDFGLLPQDRLIRVKVSKHTMFTPRSFLIILSHEISHYSNSTSRNRKYREKVFVVITSITLVNLLTKDLDVLRSYDIVDSQICMSYIEDVRKRIYNYVNSSLEAKVEKIIGYQKNEEDKEWIYHFSELWEIIKETCGEILCDENGELEKRIEYIGEELLVKASRNTEQNSDNGFYLSLQKIYNLQSQIKANIQKLNYKQTHLQFLILMVNTLKEIYADISVIQVLNLDPKLYLEAYLISESCIPEVSGFADNVINRFAIVNRVMREKSVKWNNAWERMGNIDKDEVFFVEMKKRIESYSIEMWPEGKGENCENSNNNEGSLFYCKEIIYLEYEYLKKCYDALDLHLKKKRESENGCMDALTNLFACFDVYEEGNDISFEEFFSRCDAVLRYYKLDVLEAINKDRSEKIG